MTSEEFRRQWGESAVDALYAFIAGLNDTERNGASATAILDEMGITEIRLSNAVKALASNHEGLAGAVDLANKAWEQNTALATEANTRYSTLESKLAMTENAQNNLSIAIGDVFAPTVGAAADVWADLLNGLTGFVQKHPVAVKGIASIAVGLGVAAGAISVVAAATKLWDMAVKAFTGTLLANPVTWWVVGITAVTAAIATFIVTTNNAIDPMEELTATAKEQERELRTLEAEYDEACEKYGETAGL